MPLEGAHATPVRVVDNVSRADVGRGAVEVRTFDGAVWGYAFTCPGCGARDYLPLHANNPGGCWEVASGAVADPTTVSLTPSILHRGCGWHGHLTEGRFIPL